MNFTAKHKIIVALAIWVIVLGLILGYLFKILDSSNQETVTRIFGQQKELAVLEAEKDSYTQGKEDLKKFLAKKIQPKDFFSSDITFVNEIKTLEDLEREVGLDMNLSGIRGTVESLPKAKTQGEIFAVPFRINLNGKFSKVVKFIEILENLKFITTVSQVSISSASDGEVNANLTASFFLRNE